MVFPHHVVDGGELLSIADQSWSETRHAILHNAGLLVVTNGIGTASANPARYTGWGKASGATSVAAPRGALSAKMTEPSETIRVCFFGSPEPDWLSTRPPRVVRT